jgi:hypothetical protein
MFILFAPLVESRGETMMLETLEKLETTQMLALLNDRNGWKSVLVDYHKPFVERVWRAYGDHRINLHVIHPCDASESLYHHHPWPSVMRVQKGHYEMGIGFGPIDAPTACLMRFKANVDGEFVYEMPHQDALHYVRAIDDVIHSVMLSGKPWGKDAPKSTTPLRPLPDERIDHILAFNIEYYTRRIMAAAARGS